MSGVQVLLSTYNGERYIRQQLDSIIEQTYPNIVILIRDDGSTDSTIPVIESYMESYPGKIRLILGGNKGVVRSFMELLQASDSVYDYYCFCDQDDIWLPDKVQRSVSKIGVKDQPTMFFTSTQMVDHRLNKLNIWPTPPLRQPSFNNALIQNIAVGATITINKKARELLIQKQVDDSALLMHDWWAYLCLSALGEVLYDAEPSILYRQHENNVVGGNVSRWEIVGKKWASFRKHKGKRLLVRQAQEFSKHYSHLLDAHKQEQLQWFLASRPSLLQRYQYLKKCKLYRQSSLEQRLFQILIMIGYI
ncbi:glycosyltransferase family 2 protein [Paenibacillus arenosi]|uniref:Glycosyltransferase family 2 protein n=1 Tax=Paenibacillus arenosi TaxID=2774142 RepID=A0ABR9B3X6_9BACL|nr:glycosyltransferase family 2 protein [Paenibacillus arenosi]MBD8500982.1 glycosyltransferase family 2 protein [Paenibacillus arenosi]